MQYDTLHLYTKPLVPLTASHVVQLDMDARNDMTLPGMKPHALAWCRKCRRRRLAKNLVAQYYYDDTYIWCAEPCSPPKRKRAR